MVVLLSRVSSFHYRMAHHFLSKAISSHGFDGEKGKYGNSF